MTSSESRRDRVFHGLHREGLLILPNAWDAGSARLIESLGAQAVATTSAGVAWAHGHADGHHLPVPALLATIAEMARVLRVPLSADAEGGYADDLVAVEETLGRVIEAGAVGVNLEDGSGTPDLLCAKVERAKRAGQRLGVDLFVNARTDVYLRALVGAERRVEETLARAARYRAAGADGLFVPGVTAAAEIRTIASAAGLPLNVLARPGLPPAAELQALGVRRLSAGSGVVLAALGHAAARTTAFLRTGASEPLAEGAATYADTNALMSR
jgi:2-methylisocitrate lyase-like PEP mutase family enzyme